MSGPTGHTVRKSGARSRAERLFFTLSLVTFGLASLYTSAVLLARIYPALFPGKNLGDLTSAVIGVDINDIGPISIPAPKASSPFNQRINLPVIGVDHRALGDEDKMSPEERFAGLTDTLVLLSIQPVSKSLSFLSFPRDMVVETYLPGQRPYEARINASFHQGLLAGKSVDAGARQLETDIKKNFGIDIDAYVVVDFRGVEKLVNAVGGVDVDIPHELAVPNWPYSDDDVHLRYVSFPEGLQHLDGYHAVAFGRNRDSSDFARVKRQQLVLQGAISKVFAQGLLDPTTWPDLWDAYSTTVKTDMPKSKMAGLMPLLKATNGRSDMFSLADPVDGNPTVWPDLLGEDSVVRWDPENVQYWLSRVFTSADYSEATVEIRNATARTGPCGRHLSDATWRTPSTSPRFTTDRTRSPRDDHRPLRRRQEGARRQNCEVAQRFAAELHRAELGLRPDAARCGHRHRTRLQGPGLVRRFIRTGLLPDA